MSEYRTETDLTLFLESRKRSCNYFSFLFYNFVIWVHSISNSKISSYRISVINMIFSSKRREMISKEEKNLRTSEKEREKRERKE